LIETDQQAGTLKKSIDSEIEKINHEIERNRTTIEFLSALASESREQLDDQHSRVRLTISEEMAILSQVSDQLVPEDDSALYAERGEQIAAQKKNNS
jgi:predicted  nucleic acid-binding Zn-ribbon protein